MTSFGGARRRRAEGTIVDAAFQRIEQELDWSELDLQQMLGGDDFKR